LRGTWMKSSIIFMSKGIAALLDNCASVNARQSEELVKYLKSKSL